MYKAQQSGYWAFCVFVTCVFEMSYALFYLFNRVVGCVQRHLLERVQDRGHRFVYMVPLDCFNRSAKVLSIRYICSIFISTTIFSFLTSLYDFLFPTWSSELLLYFPCTFSCDFNCTFSYYISSIFWYLYSIKVNYPHVRKFGRTRVSSVRYDTRNGATR